MAAEHKHPGLLGNRGAILSRYNTCQARTEALLLWNATAAHVYVANPTLVEAFLSNHVRGHEFAQVGWLRCAQARVSGERKHESQQHLPQQRGRLLADGASGS